MRAENVVQVFCGHTHRPFYKEIDKLLICDIGSAGMPLDGAPRPSWVMITKDDSGIESVFIRSVTYDISSMLQLIDSISDYYDFQIAGYQEAYKKMFIHGNPWRAYMPNNSSQ
jgi:diadenosine tetraphosphatase ApaH/serine/threonine PP2A family protein phosphatase